jgi:hypothetical protein
MHLEDARIIHIFEAAKRRAEVQRVDDKRTPYRVTFCYNHHRLVPRYFRDLEDATDHAKRFAFRPISPYQRITANPQSRPR